MNNRVANAALAVAGLIAPVSFAQTPVGYRLATESAMTEKFCLPPCECAEFQRTGPLAGEFTLTRTTVDPQYVNYAVTGLRCSATINGLVISIAGYGTYRHGGPFPGDLQELALDLVVNGAAQHYDSGLVATDPLHPFPQISITTMDAVYGCRQNLLDVIALPDPGVCYPNCDDSTVAPVLNVLDFTCFLNAFAAGDPYANCDGSTTAPILNVLDFECFLNRFAAGCP